MQLNRREFLWRGAAAAALAAVPGFLTACARSGAALAPSTAPGTVGAMYFAHTFGIDDALLSAVMSRALARGGDFCDIYLEHSLMNSIQLEDGQVNAARTNVDLGVGIRVVQGTRFGYAFTEDLTLESMLKAADTA